MLQDHLNRREAKQILAAHHMADALIGVIEGRGEEIGDDLFILAVQNDVADVFQRPLGIDAVAASMRRTGIGIDQPFGVKLGQRFGKIKPQRIARFAV